MHEHWSPPVDPRLAGLVGGVAGYRFTGLEPGVHVGMPGPHLTVIVPCDEPIVVSGVDGEPRPWRASVAGLHDVPAHVHHGDAQHGVQVDLTPAGARALLGLPAAALAGEIVELDEVLPGLADRTRDAGSLREKVDVVVEGLVARAGEGRSPRPELGYAWAEIRRTRGTVPVWAVASQVGWSARHLGEQFKVEYGVSPKTAGRLMRFDRARRLVSAGVPLAETATRCGYADQAHLNRDWRAFVGLSPTRWRAEDQLAFVQDAG